MFQMGSPLSAEVKRTEVKDEKELESLLIDDLGELEEGLRFLGRQIATDSGALDILAVDKDGLLVVIELKVNERDDQLFQGIRYFDWVKSRIEWISRSFQKEYDFKINVMKDPWLFLVAPSFSDNLKKVSRYVELNLMLFEYDVIQIGDKKKVLCRETDYGEPYEPEEVPTVQGHQDYIEDPEIKTVFEKAIEDIKSKGIKVEPKKRRITLRHKGKIIGRIWCRKTWFFIRPVFDDKIRHAIRSEDQWNDFRDNVLYPNL